MKRITKKQKEVTLNSVYKHLAENKGKVLIDDEIWYDVLNEETGEIKTYGWVYPTGYSYHSSIDVLILKYIKDKVIITKNKYINIDNRRCDVNANRTVFKIK